MTKFLKSGNVFNVTDDSAIDISSHLPGANYVVKFDIQRGVFFLEKIEDFTLPHKVYGDNPKLTTRIINTFNNRSGATGILLKGDKGSGKSLLSKSLAIKLKEQNVPTLIINSPFCGDVFNKFIQTIEQPCAVIFDEFEKVYDQEKQEMMLTLLDGMFPSKKLFILTANNGKIDVNMKNRPGRIYYHIEYGNITEEVIREYCDDNLNDKTHLDKIVDIASCFGQFNFDMLVAIVAEMNLYNEPPATVMKLLNARLSNDSGMASYDVDVYLDGKLVKNSTSPDILYTTPISQITNICVYNDRKVVFDDELSEEESFKLDPFHDCPDFGLNDDNILKVHKGGTISYRFDHHGREVRIDAVKKSIGKFYSFDAF